jgi:hypothetical protein
VERVVRFRKKPVVIEAMQLDGQSAKVAEWLNSYGCKFTAQTHPTDSKKDSLLIETLEGTMIAAPGDWIIRGVEGEFYPCKPDIFAKTYFPDDAPGDRSTDGHTFRIEWSVRGSSRVEPGGPYTDSNYFSEPSVFEIRGWSLKEALANATRLSFSALQGFCRCSHAEVGENGYCTTCERPVGVGGGV